MENTDLVYSPHFINGEQRLSGAYSGMDGGKLGRRALGFWSNLQLWSVFSQSFTMHPNYFKPGGEIHTQASPVQIFKGFLMLKEPKRWVQMLAGAKENLNRHIDHEFQWHSDPKSSNGNVIYTHSHLYSVFQ